MLNEKTVATTAPYQDSKPSVPALLACAFQSDQSTPYQQRGVHLLKKYFTAQALGGFLVWGGKEAKKAKINTGSIILRYISCSSTRTEISPKTQEGGVTLENAFGLSWEG